MQDSMEEFKQEQDETFRKQDSVEEFKQEQEETFRKLSSGLLTMTTMLNLLMKVVLVANSFPVLNDINAMESPDIVAKAAKVFFGSSVIGDQIPAPSSPRDGDDVTITVGHPQVRMREIDRFTMLLLEFVKCWCLIFF
nr:cation-chloride cotransporter 1-like [Ipomoea batatas]GMD77984.1 cation-chloride cotransporter 1-like [Ipomoea batatas]